MLIPRGFLHVTLRELHEIAGEHFHNENKGSVFMAGL